MIVRVESRSAVGHCLKEIVMKLSIAVAALLCITSACRTVDHAAFQSGDTQKAPPAKDSPVSGAISEDAFKKLHELKEGAVPTLLGEMIEIGGTKAYLSIPKTGAAPFPAIVVIHEWWGLNDNVKHWADRFAADGYAALAVDLYDGVVAKNSDQAMAAMKKVDAAAAEKTLLSAHRFLAVDKRVQAKKRGSVGWCFGGGKSLALGLATKELDACVMYYGHPETDPQKLAALHAPLLGIFGARDASIPPEKVAEFDQALTKAGKEHTILSYDAEHAFANPSNPKYDEKNAAMAWEKVRAFFAQHLKGAK